MEKEFFQNSVGQLEEYVRADLSDKEIRMKCAELVSNHTSPTNAIDSFIKLTDKLADYIINGKPE